MFTKNQIVEEYRRWKTSALSDPDLADELGAIEGKEKDVFDRFYRNLEFGTGGLRGVIGAGTNRVNVYTLGKASQGYANYLKAEFKQPSVAIAYDSRIKSALFAKTAAEVFAGNGIRVFLYPALMPTPALSFAVRELCCSGGVMITASHNPAAYNGYKVYGADGCQITLSAAERILSEIEGVDLFSGVRRLNFEEGLAAGSISYIEEAVVDKYLARIAGEGLRLQDIKKDVSIVYTPLNGAGLRCVTRSLRENGFSNIFVVPEQQEPDGRFPTCPYPNPEMREALELGLSYAKKLKSDLLLATDPDSDRVGIAVRDKEDYRLLSGNQMGALLFDYICKSRLEKGRMPARPLAVKTIVTTELAGAIAKKYGVELIDVLTGFKFIGEQIGLLEQKGQESRYIFGFEESCGYLTGTFVRDKDGVNASLMIAEMFAYYKERGLSLPEVLESLYLEHGYYRETLQGFDFEGADGLRVMQRIMKGLRERPPKTAPFGSLACLRDYGASRAFYPDGGEEEIGLPVSDVLGFDYEGGLSAVVRPSGTEPKLKIYYFAKGETAEAAYKLEEQIRAFFTRLIEEYKKQE